MVSTAPRQARRFLNFAAAGLVPIAVAGLLWLLHANARASDTVDKRSTTMASLFEHYPDARAYRIDLQTGERWECVLAHPPTAGASGPPAFTYDASGRRVAWTFDDGDSPSYTN